MRKNRSQLVVKTAALLTALLALVALVAIIYGALSLVRQGRASSRFYQDLGLLGLVSIIPLMFLWAALQAWRFVPRGIVSVSSGWILFGLIGSIFSLFSCSLDWDAKVAALAVISTCVFLFGILIFRQAKAIASQPGFGPPR